VVNVPERWQTGARRLHREVYALYLACRDRRVPWYAKAIAAGVVAYALSPIDLIPDFIPVLGYLDELVVIPFGVLVARRLMPPAVLAECRARADEVFRNGRPVSRLGAAIVVSLWLAVAVGAVMVSLWLVRRAE
jgi:uncharacterized membrane protein YkvA (DUF1232 family)